MSSEKILINLEATTSCPATCPMCPRHLVPTGLTLSLKKAAEVVERMDPEMVWELGLAGRGEPTIHPQFPELLATVAKAPVTTCVTTTGVGLGKRRLEAVGRFADRVRLSVSSVDPEVFAQVHRGLPYHQVWERISQLAKVAKERVIIHLTGGPEIHPSLPRTVERLRELGYKNFRILPLWSRAGAVKLDPSQSSRKTLAKKLGLQIAEAEFETRSLAATLGQLFKDKLHNWHHCPVGAKSLTISASGDYLACFQDFASTTTLGNVSSVSLGQALERQRDLLGRMSVCDDCEGKSISRLVSLGLGR